jgi:hypothetical protein
VALIVDIQVLILDHLKILSAPNTNDLLQNNLVDRILERFARHLLDEFVAAVHLPLILGDLLVFQGVLIEVVDDLLLIWRQCQVH